MKRIFLVFISFFVFKSFPENIKDCEMHLSKHISIQYFVTSCLFFTFPCSFENVSGWLLM